MIADLKPYAEYKESGLPWLEQVPGHWELRRMKYVVREVDSRSTTGKEQLLRVSQYTGVTQRHRADGLEEPDTRADSLVGYKRVEPDDLVINIMLAWNGSMGVSRYDGIASPAYCVYRLGRGFHPWYFHNLLRSPAYKEKIKASSTGVVESRLRLYSDDLGRIEAILPPPAEQAAIVRFLDWANGRLERAIRAKRKVIALLNEQKQAIIHRAVTSGLDPSVPLKPSGIPWLGDIPQHWEVTKLSRACFYQEGPGLRTWQFTESGVQVICVTNITANGVDLAAYGRFISRDEYDAKYRHFTVERGDVMLASSGNSWGKIAEFTGGETVILNTSTVRLNPARFGRVLTSFLKLFLGAEYVRLQLQSLLTGSCQPNFGPSHLNRVIVTFPSDLAAQDAIVSEVHWKVAPLDITISRLEREIELLREYRARLVADVVTGKLDVREAAVRLPDEAPLDSVEDDADLTMDPEAADEEAAV